MNHQKHPADEIIIFTRFPEPGSAKTRLIPLLGKKGAADLQRSMTEQIVQTARDAALESGRRLLVSFTGGSAQQMEHWLGRDLQYHEQEGGGIGARILHALLDSRRRGADCTVILAADCPFIDIRIIEESFQRLATTQVVLGPTMDGGVYLVGIGPDISEKILRKLLAAIPWGTPSVLAQTIDRAKQARLSTATLTELRDIDNPEDLAHLHHYSHAQ